MNTIQPTKLQAFIDDNGDVRLCLDCRHLCTLKKEEYTPAVQAAVLAAWEMGCYDAIKHASSTVVPVNACSTPFVEPERFLPIHTCERPSISGFRHREKEEFAITNKETHEASVRSPIRSISDPNRATTINVSRGIRGSRL